MLGVAGYIDPAVEAWLSGITRVPALLGGKP